MKWLLASGGVSQLLTQIAALEDNSYSVEGNDVVSVCYYFNREMELAIQEVCDEFGLNYRGNLEPIDYNPQTLAHLSKFQQFIYRWFPRRIHRDVLKSKGWSINDRYDGLVVAIRPWVFDELFVHSVVAPRKVLCTIDGVNPRSPDRKLTGEMWHGLESPFSDLPTQCPVYCPSYLERDAAQLGQAKVIADDVESRVFDRYTRTPLAQQLDQLLNESFAGFDRAAIIFSQQLAQCQYMNEDEEISYYLETVKKLNDRGYHSVIFKQHPRDPLAKLQTLEARFDPSIVRIIPQTLSCIPIEPFLSQSKDVELLGVSTNSTVLLSVRALANAKTASSDSTLFNADFRKVRDIFCREHKVSSI